MAAAQERQTQLAQLEQQYKAALYGTPRDEQACLQLALAIQALCLGTRLEQSAAMRIKRHQPKGE